MKKQSIIKGLICGAAAGALGAAIMDLYWWAVRGVWGARPEQEPRPGDQVEENRHATQVMADRLAKALTGRPVPEGQKAGAGVGAHYAAGVTFGSLFGAIVSRRTRTGPLAGLLYGALVWLLFNVIAIRAMRMASEPEKVPTRDHAQALGAHLLYGTSVALASRLLLRVGR